MRILVTGSGGFVGRALCEALVERGDEVVGLDVRAPSPPIDGVEQVEADVRDSDALMEAIGTGFDVVIHNASVVHTKQNRKDLVHAVNVGGTENVLRACRAHTVDRLVYVSSASVVYEGNDIEGGDESLPYASTFPAPYAESKAIAEKLVLDANGDEIATVAIRPHVIFGPGDLRFAPAVLKNAKNGKLKIKVGFGDKLSDFTYVDNLIDALLLATDALAIGAKIGGQAYFVTNGEPWHFWEFISRLVEPLGFKGPKIGVPYHLAYGAAWIRETIDTLRGGTLDAEDGFSRFAIRYITTHHYFSHQRATDDFGYKPAVSVEEGIRRTVDYLRETGAV